MCCNVFIGCVDVTVSLLHPDFRSSWYCQGVQVRGHLGGCLRAQEIYKSFEDRQTAGPALVRSKPDMICGVWGCLWSGTQGCDLYFACACAVYMCGGLVFCCVLWGGGGVCGCFKGVT